jgi:ribosomal protein S15P/S13E
MATQQKYKGGKKSRKLGRNKSACAVYEAGCVRERNKIRKMKRHLRRHPADLQNARRLQELV